MPGKAQARVITLSRARTHKAAENFRGAARVRRVFIRAGAAARPPAGHMRPRFYESIYIGHAPAIRVNCSTNAIYSRRERASETRGSRKKFAPACVCSRVSRLRIGNGNRVAIDDENE